MFRSYCASCHGLNARGGGRGPDLTDDRWVHGSSDDELFRIVSEGIPSTEMRSADLYPEDIRAILAYLKSLRGNTGAPVPGDRVSGEALFFSSGLCSQCHRGNGKGGRLGPDLTRIGAARSTQYLIDSVREPSKEIPERFEAVSVTTRDGTRITGVRPNEDTFSIQLLDGKEMLHMFLKKDLRDVSYEKESLMPEYPPSALDQEELQNLIAYLDGLRGRQ